jgi:hypothetical protein
MISEKHIPSKTTLFNLSLTYVWPWPNTANNLLLYCSIRADYSNTKRTKEPAV